MGVARAWSRSEMGKFLPSLSVNFIIYLQNVWSAMSLSLLVPEKRLSPVCMSIRLYTEIREFQDFTVERP